jgi:hypothetical protein
MQLCQCYSAGIGSYFMTHEIFRRIWKKISVFEDDALSLYSVISYYFLEKVRLDYVRTEKIL